LKKLYRFCWDCGRNGWLRGIFVEDEKIIEKFMGCEVYFGEVLGKHSEVFGTLDPDDLTVLTDDQSFIEKFEEFDCESGHNPISYMMERAYEDPDYFGEEENPYYEEFEED
jgi:hypothetical protein